jgi:hypothetical protein
MVQVPWRLNNNPSASTSTTSPVTSSDSPGGSAARAELVVIPAIVEQPVKVETEVQPVTSEGDSMQVYAGKEGEEEKPGKAVPSAKTGGEEGVVGNDIDVMEGSPSSSAVEEKDSEVKKEKEEVVKTKLQRILGRKHFDVALVEIRPSSSEEGTLPELRKVCQGSTPIDECPC